MWLFIPLDYYFNIIWNSEQDLVSNETVFIYTLCTVVSITKNEDHLLISGRPDV